MDQTDHTFATHLQCIGLGSAPAPEDEELLPQDVHKCGQEAANDQEEAGQVFLHKGGVYWDSPCDGSSC